MESLSRLFGSPARIKLLRLFMFNDDASFTVTDAAFRISSPKESVRKEINLLVKAGIVRKRSVQGAVSYTASKKFSHYFALQSFLRASTDLSDSHIVSTLKKAGSLRLVALSGMFTNVAEVKVDILIVGDKLDEKRLGKAVHELEAELGRELRYAMFSTEDFRYRVGVYDRLVRDIFDYPHRTLLDKIGLKS